MCGSANNLTIKHYDRNANTELEIREYKLENVKTPYIQKYYKIRRDMKSIYWNTYRYGAV